MFGQAEKEKGNRLY